MTIIKVGLRQLALKHHPDRGGKLEDMKLLNISADCLNEWLSKVR